MDYDVCNRQTPLIPVVTNVAYNEVSFLLIFLIVNNFINSAISSFWYHNGLVSMRDLRWISLFFVITARFFASRMARTWWARLDSNQGPLQCQ